MNTKQDMLTNIQIDDGMKRVSITNKFGDEVGVFYFNPTDIGIVERFSDLSGEFDEIIAPLDSLKDDSNEDAVQNAYREAKDRLFNACNKLFNGNFAEAFFGKVNPFSPVNGMFYCEQALNAVGEYVGKQFDSELKKIEARARKYTNNIRSMQGHKRAKK